MPGPKHAFKLGLICCCKCGTTLLSIVTHQPPPGLLGAEADLPVALGPCTADMGSGWGAPGALGCAQQRSPQPLARHIQLASPTRNRGLWGPTELDCFPGGLLLT